MVLLRKQNEIGRSLHFNAQTPDNPRLAYSISVMIWYSRLRAKEKQTNSVHLPRLPQPREHANATTKAYAYPRDWSVNGGEDGSILLNRTPPQAGTRRGVASEPLCVPPERMRPEQATLVRRSGIINLKGRSSFFLNLSLEVRTN